jgi:hypothetical protein
MIKMTKEGLLQTRQRGRRLAAIYTYWISTILPSLLYLSSAYLYLTKREWVQQVLGNLGYSAGYLAPLMIVVNILGLLAASFATQNVAAKSRHPTGRQRRSDTTPIKQLEPQRR